MAERELCDEQNEANQEAMQKYVGQQDRPSGLAGHIDPYHLKPWHGRTPEKPEDDGPQQEERSGT